MEKTMINIPCPKSCSECPLKVVEEDMEGDYFYYCPSIKEAIRGKKYYEQRFRQCPLVKGE